MNKEQIIEAVGQEYTKWFYDNAVPSVSGKPILNGEGILTRGKFINKCKTDPEFSEKWGLKIEERELSRLERINIAIEKKLTHKTAHLTKDFDYQKWCDEQNVPTKLITLTYNNETITSYE